MHLYIYVFPNIHFKIVRQTPGNIRIFKDLPDIIPQQQILHF